ncbi:MAG: FIST N-terminal domain-containing protein [Candidatus Woesearchaeota archaeon]
MTRKYVFTGIGVSANEDSYQAAKEAAKEARDKCGKEPIFSIVYVDSKYNPEQVNIGIKEVLQNNWIGCSTDTQFTNTHGYKDRCISVFCIFSQYLHFSVGVVDNYRENPLKAGEQAIIRAMQDIKIDSYIDPYLQFKRTQTKSFSDIVRNPPYFILTLLSGAKYIDGKPVPGMETEFLEGIYNITGPNIPIIGASASTNFEEYKKFIGNNFQFANGNVYYNSGIAVFVVSNLYFSYTLLHGYTKTDKVALLTKLDQTGHLIKEINGRSAVDEYSRLLGVSKDEFLKNPFFYTLSRPIGLIDPTGTLYIKEAVPSSDGETMYSLCKLLENSAINIVNYSPQATLTTIVDSISEGVLLNNFSGEIGFALIFSCCGRKALLGTDVSSEINEVTKKFVDLPFCGFHSFGEIGARPNRPSQAVNQSVSTLIVFDRLLTE